jgi:lactate dehydrogenase-like 2-hydroxyacid dehydrogenase
MYSMMSQACRMPSRRWTMWCSPPHVAGLSPDAVEATVVMVIENLRAHFAGLPVLTPIGA